MPARGARQMGHVQRTGGVLGKRAVNVSRQADVAVIVATYNRCACLKVTLNACLEQNGNFYIFVVNNASTDGTAAYLEALAAREQRITALHLLTNTGGAGAFRHGMKIAHSTGAVWYWVMDDDVAPLPGALETLLYYGRYGRCVYPAKICADGRLFAFEGRIDRNTLKRSKVHNLPELEHQSYVSVNSGNFEGALIHNDVVEKIGFPDSRFFLCWDDTLYGMQAAEHFPCIYIKYICMKKQFDKERLHIGKRAFVGSSVFSRYYFFRNYWFVIRYLQSISPVSPQAYVRYFIELLRSLILTCLVDRDFVGALRITIGAYYGYRGMFVGLSSR
jgi:glycosyltransferase involved in cell wall biosynthesis